MKSHLTKSNIEVFKNYNDMQLVIQCKDLLNVERFTRVKSTHVLDIYGVF